MLDKMQSTQQIEFTTKSNSIPGKHELYIGLMSGTSADGVDASIISTDGHHEMSIIGNIHLPYDKGLQQKIKALNPYHKSSIVEENALEHRLLKQSQDKFDQVIISSAIRSQDNSAIHNCPHTLVHATAQSTITELLQTEQELTDYHITAVKLILKNYNLNADQIRAIGFHGQTIYHAPEQQITCQIGNANRLAIQTNIDVVYDFRRTDVELGGQGAPLIPIFHQCIAMKYGIPSPTCFINIGGVSNITYINRNDIIAFDSGPGNGLIDRLTEKLFGKSYDTNGELARAGKINDTILAKFMTNPYFAKPYPKSLDVYHFENCINDTLILDKYDAIATITAFTAKSITESFKTLPELPKEIFLCGGGVHNVYLIELLKKLSAELGVETPKLYTKTNAHKTNIHNIAILQDLDPDYIESQGFAYLAARKIMNLPSAFPKTTGATKSSVCGVLINPR